MFFQELRFASAQSYHLIYRRQSEAALCNVGLEALRHRFDSGRDLFDRYLVIVQHHIHLSVMIELIDVSHLYSGSGCCPYKAVSHLAPYLISPFIAVLPSGDHLRMGVEPEDNVYSRLGVFCGQKISFTSILPYGFKRLLQLGRVQLAHSSEVGVKIAPLHEFSQGQLLRL